MQYHRLSQQRAKKQLNKNTLSYSLEASDLYDKANMMSINGNNTQSRIIFRITVFVYYLL